MDHYKDEWLSHLKGAIPPEAIRNRTSLYTIALEGWRRGLKLKFHRKINDDHQMMFLYSLENEERRHFFNESSGDANTVEAFNICKDKGLTSQYLKRAGIPVPLGNTFGQDSSMNEIVDYGNEISYPLVVKPTDGSSGKGVIINIQNENQLKDAVNHIRNELHYENIIVQQHVMGEEVRIYVLEDQVLAAANRMPANIVGNGQLTIIKLIEEKNKYRKQVPHLHHRPIRIDAEVRKLINDAGYTLDSVLKENERLFLRKVSNVSTGGDPIDVTDQLSEEQKRIAIAATKAIPGLVHSGVDMIINKCDHSGIILELNTRPGIGSHLFPVEGIARDIPKAIIDYYFPETKGYNKRNSNVYFDLQTVFDVLNDGYVSEIEMEDHPCNRLLTKKFVITSDLDALTFYKVLKRPIHQQGFCGFIQPHNNKVVIVLAHENWNSIQEFQTLLYRRRKQLQISSIDMGNWERPIRSGFGLTDGLNQMSIIELESNHNQLYKEMRTFQIEVQRLNKRIELMKLSRAWRMTAPLRLIKGLIQR